MAGTKEIQNRIKSIKDTMKITNAMYMMSSMKLRKARNRLAETEPYFYGLEKEITDILLHFPDMENLYFDNRAEDNAEKIKRKAFIVVTGDKGMAGAYNHNVLKEARRRLEGVDNYRLMVIGELGRRYFSNAGFELEEGFNYSTNNPTMHRARIITEHVVDMYKNEEIDSLTIIYTRMVNSMREDVEVKEILPLKTHDFIKNELIEMEEKGDANFDKDLADSADDWFYIYPSPKVVLEKLAYNYVTGFMYGVLVEGAASEENARMMAMQSATDNAAAMLHELSVEYNRVRQAAITQEITEVIGGAKALKKKKKKVKKDHGE